MWNTIRHLLGVDNASGPWYLWWSGPGAFLAYLGTVATLWRHVNCHTRRCWRFGRHSVDGTPYKVCRRHHPEIPNRGATLAQIHEAHANRNVG
jgi:hypothetical protein